MKKINEFTAVALGIGFGLGKLVEGVYAEVIAGSLVICVIGFVLYTFVRK